MNSSASMPMLALNASSGAGHRKCDLDATLYQSVLLLNRELRIEHRTLTVQLPTPNRCVVEHTSFKVLSWSLEVQCFREKSPTRTSQIPSLSADAHAGLAISWRAASIILPCHIVLPPSQATQSHGHV